MYKIYFPKSSLQGIELKNKRGFVKPIHAVPTEGHFLVEISDEKIAKKGNIFQVSVEGKSGDGTQQLPLFIMEVPQPPNPPTTFGDILTVIGAIIMGILIFSVMSILF